MTREGGVYRLGTRVLYLDNRFVESHTGLVSSSSSVRRRGGESGRDRGKGTRPERTQTDSSRRFRGNQRTKETSLDNPSASRVRSTVVTRRFPALH